MGTDSKRDPLGPSAFLSNSTTLCKHLLSSVRLAVATRWQAREAEPKHKWAWGHK